MKLFRSGGLLLCISLFSLFFHGSGFAVESKVWWNDQWQYRKKIAFDTTANGADIKQHLDEVPVLIRLHSGNFNFTNAREDGHDIRFAAADNQTLLKHHIERYDLLDELALIWVKVPRLSADSALDHLWMYYGNEEAMGGQDAGGTYDPGYAGVYHLNELEGLPQDSSSYGNDAVRFSGGRGLPSVIGTGITLAGGGDSIRVPDSPSIDLSEGFTVSSWIRINQSQENAVLFAKGAEESSVEVGIDGTKVFCRIAFSKEKTIQTEKTADLSFGTWHHLAVVGAPGQRLSIFLDGLEMTFAALPEALPQFPDDLSIGAALNSERALVGDLDELRISTLPRSEAWVLAQLRSQGPESSLTTVDVEQIGEGSGGLPVFYLATIMKNITLDGWVIIGCLLVLSLLSWMIMISKSFFLWIIGRENRQFREAYENLKDVVFCDQQDLEYSNSSLYRVYSAGCKSLKRWFAQQQIEENPGKKTLSNKAVNTFRGVLEKGLVEEAKRMNAWLVVLTMSISGGPFLGLLGTVWGVMNTFAAMAEAGEANIMAIAPGVASALSTTVFGLIVAIPALFGYNFLAGRIRNLTAELNVFADEFALKVEEIYGG